MEYKINKHYAKEELDNICNWWQNHKEFDIIEHDDYIEIVEREDHGAISIIGDLKNYLLETDYIIPKIQEAMLLDPEEAENLKTKYAETLQKRQEARQKIKELEQYL